MNNFGTEKNIFCYFLTMWDSRYNNLKSAAFKNKTTGKNGFDAL